MTIVRSDRVVLPDGVRPASIRIAGGRIAAIAEPDAPADGAREIDAREYVVLPGLVDTHVHINEPGRTDWEGFASATRAAAAGGITTIVDMPLNSIPPTTTVTGFRAKLDAAHGQCHVDVGFWGGVVPGNTPDIEPLAAAGVLGFKAFLSPSGVDEFENVTESDLRGAMPAIAWTRLPLLVHAEWPQLLSDPDPHADPRAYSTWLNSRPAAAEHVAIDLLVGLSDQSGARVHVVHLASADALPALSAARARGVPITVETCPHYLTFAAEGVPDGATQFKCAPPIRERHHRERLWGALSAGAIDLVATDHSPAPPALKHVADGDFVRAWGGIASLQIALPLAWTGAQKRWLPIERIAEWMSAAPARLAGLDATKGAIAVGRDADLVVFDDRSEMTIDATKLYHRHAVTPYDGERVRGRVVTTILRGEVIFEAGHCVGAPRGRPIVRNLRDEPS